MQNKSILIGLLCCILSPIALADMPSAQNPNDRYETYNRHAYKMNKKLDQLIFKPVASLYKDATPTPIRKGINNFLSNLSQIPAVINDVLQLNFGQAGKDIARFGINTTLGLAGFLDIASYAGLDRNPQDFGLTLAKWGYQSSNYLVLPILGPSTVRDAIAWPIYYEMTIYPYLNDATLTWSLLTLNFIDFRTQLLDLDPVIEQSFDPYVFERDAYLQRRKFLIQKNAGYASQNSPSPTSQTETEKNDTHTGNAEHETQD
jgi:phospholipid-binding lipoprotein MlaA